MAVLGAKLSDRYEIVRELGRGGMGVVYLARDPLLDRDVAIKLIPPDLLSTVSGERFRREAQIIAKMDHPSVVPVYDFGEFEGALFFVMPLVIGSSLRAVLREGSLRFVDALEIGIQVASALDYSHGQGIVHRALRPENIMVARGESEGIRVRLMDFGLVQASFESQLTRMATSGSLEGGAAYVSPEQVDGRDIDVRSDLHALGAVLYECLTGSPPFTGDLQAVLYRIVHEAATPPSARGIQLDPALESILMRCLAKDPAARPERGNDIADVLAACRARLDDSDKYRVVGHSGEIKIGGAARPRDSLPLVGRDRELGELHRRMNAAVAGETQFVVIGGEPGIGKSRLLEEVETIARARRIRVLHGRFIEQDRGFPYQGFCDVLQEYLRSVDHSSVSQEVADFSDLASDLVALFPVLSEMAEFAEPSNPHDSQEIVTPKLDDKTAVFDVLARSITRLAIGRPLVLLFKDLHGADVSIEALQYVVRRLGLAPVLIVGSYRTTEVDRRHALSRMIASFRGDKYFASMTLGPLCAADHRALIEAIVGGPPLVDATAATLHAATEGNPFFTRELVKSLIDSGGLAEDETGQLSMSSDIGVSSDALPETIQQVVERQIERLPADLRETLTLACMLGRTFELRDLESIVDSKAELEDAIDRLIRLGLLEEREWRGDRFTFASRVVRDVLYAGISRRRRRTLHRRIAEALESRYADRLDRMYARLLHHYSQGDVGEKAVEYGFLAALKALDAFSADDAVSAVRTALEFLEDDDWEGDRALEGEARLLLAGAYRLQGNTSEALREAERAIQIFERESQIAHEVRALLMAAEIAWDGRKVDEARRLADRGIEAARAQHDNWALSRLLTLGATVANLRGEYERAREYLEEAEKRRPSGMFKPAKVPKGGRLVVALNNPLVIACEPATIQTSDDEEIIANVFECLLTTDAQCILAPALAERGEVVDGGMRFVFSLQRDATFSDGTKLTEALVKASFQRTIRMNRSALPGVFETIRGVDAFLAADAGASLEGVVALSDDRLEIRLEEPLPIYPAMLTDVSAAIALAVVDEDGTERALGTGPFRVALRTDDQVELEANPCYAGPVPPNLDAIDFRPKLTGAALTEAFRAGEVDIARGFSPDDLERILRDHRLRATLVDTPRRDSCFVLFNTRGPATSNLAVRRALAGVVRTRALVWASLGRAALPATGLIPPGMLGHDPGRRLPSLTREQAIEMLRSAGYPDRVRIVASVSPKFAEIHGDLLANLLSTWTDIGVDVEISTATVDAYRATMHDPSGVDLMLSRWTGDYADPDNFTHAIFHSRTGWLRQYASSPELDALAEQARTETRPALRDTLYRKFEQTMIESATVVPLFHDADYRLLSRAVRGLKFGSSAPFVNYGRIGKAVVAATGPLRAPATVLSVETSVRPRLLSLDPAGEVSTWMDELLPLVFEPLVRIVDGARIVPWLASDFAMEEDGRRFRFTLRDDVRFHDGRAMTARDVRFSFERLLQSGKGSNRTLLQPIRGARDLIEGRVGDLEGFRILSQKEFSIELERPLAFFPAMLTTPVTSIVPEAASRFTASWRDGCVGTGPFRVVRLDPGERLEVERNPAYWRDGFPKSDGIVFSFGVPREQVIADLRDGRTSLALALDKVDEDALRADRTLQARFFETHRLSVAFAALNSRSGPLADVELRRAVVRALDVETPVRRAMGRFARPAPSLIPPGLLGHDSGFTSPAGAELPAALSHDVTLRVAIAPGFGRSLQSLSVELFAALERAGVRPTVVATTTEELELVRASHEVDLVLTSWVIDYPDTDSLLMGLINRAEGAYGWMFGSAELDSLIERGREQIDPAARHSTYRQVEALLVRDALVVPLVYPPDGFFALNELEGVTSSALTYPVIAYEALRMR
ncbi:MAG: protein kinase [Blastocatellia bacterium]|nr:protein kinase [Blastocatellia bacterium]